MKRRGSNTLGLGTYAGVHLAHLSSAVNWSMLGFSYNVLRKCHLHHQYVCIHRSEQERYYVLVSMKPRSTMFCQPYTHRHTADLAFPQNDRFTRLYDDSSPCHSN